MNDRNADSAFTATIVRVSRSEQGRWTMRPVRYWEIQRSDGKSGGLYRTKADALAMCEAWGLPVQIDSSGAP
jgi:hypothetical protein